MKKLLLLSLLALSAFGQVGDFNNSPDCYFTATLTSATRTSAFDNRQSKCDIWVVQVVNLSNASAGFTFDRGATSTGTWISILTTGVAATAASYNNNLQETDAYVSLNLTSKGTGNVLVAISGYRSTGKLSSSGSGPDTVPYTVLQDVASASVTYIGFAKSIFDPVTNTSYAITAVLKQTSSGGNMTSVQWADGDSKEDNIWANRAALTYK